MQVYICAYRQQTHINLNTHTHMYIYIKPTVDSKTLGLTMRPRHLVMCQIHGNKLTMNPPNCYCNGTFHNKIAIDITHSTWHILRWPSPKSNPHLDMQPMAFQLCSCSI